MPAPEPVRLSDFGDLLTIPELQSLLRCSAGTAYGLVRSGTLPHIRPGKKDLVPKSAVERYLTGTVTA